MRSSCSPSSRSAGGSPRARSPAASSRWSCSRRRSSRGRGIVLVDELSLGLAPVVVQRLVPVLEAVAASGVGVLLIEQFAHVALGLAQTAYVLERGRIHYHGTAQRLKDEPELLQSAYLLREVDPGGEALESALVAAWRAFPEPAAARCRPSAGPSPRPSWGARSRTSTSSILQPEALQNYGHVWGESYWDEDDRGSRRDREAPRGPRCGVPDARRSDRSGPRPLHPAHTADQRRGRPQHRRRYRRLRVPRAPELPPLPQRRGDRRSCSSASSARESTTQGSGRRSSSAPSRSTASSATSRGSSTPWRSRRARRARR